MAILPVNFFIRMHDDMFRDPMTPRDYLTPGLGPRVYAPTFGYTLLMNESISYHTGTPTILGVITPEPDSNKLDLPVFLSAEMGSGDAQLRVVVPADHIVAVPVDGELVVRDRHGTLMPNVLRCQTGVARSQVIEVTLTLPIARVVYEAVVSAMLSGQDDEWVKVEIPKEKPIETLDITQYFTEDDMV